MLVRDLASPWNQKRSGPARLKLLLQTLLIVVVNQRIRFFFFYDDSINYYNDCLISFLGECFKRGVIYYRLILYLFAIP